MSPKHDAQATPTTRPQAATQPTKPTPRPTTRPAPTRAPNATNIHVEPLFQITRIHAILQVLPTQKKLKGQLRIALRVRNKPLRTLVLPLVRQVIHKAFDSNGRIRVKRHGKTVHLTLPMAWPPGKTNHLVINYSVQRPRGLVFGKDLVYTSFHTCHWLICSPYPGHRTHFRLELMVPYQWDVFATGKRVRIASYRFKWRTHVWKTKRAFPTYLLGFVAGKLRTHKVSTQGMDLVYYWQGLTKRDVQRMFRDMPAMLQFFQMVAGISLPHRTYRQVLVDEPAAQEVSQHAILGKRFLRPLLTNPREDWLPAHELAHQWWGNWITCKDWSHMWLNEGLVTFLVAAYKQRRWGNHAYQRELSLARKRYANAKRRGFDVPLSYTGRYPSLRIKRAIVYSKGALFFATLRTHLGERRFWRALREYTRQYRGKIVTSHDLQRAFESSTKTSLTSLFQTWVYGTNNAPKKHSPIARPH